jgi:hypothetical protein
MRLLLAAQGGKSTIGPRPSTSGGQSTTQKGRRAMCAKCPKSLVFGLSWNEANPASNLKVLLAWFRRTGGDSRSAPSSIGSIVVARRPARIGDDETLPVRHDNLGQRVGVDDLIRADDLIDLQQIRGERIVIVVAE